MGRWTATSLHVNARAKRRAAVRNCPLCVCREDYESKKRRTCVHRIRLGITFRGFSSGHHHESISSWGCKREETLTTATILQRGHFSRELCNYSTILKGETVNFKYTLNTNSFILQIPQPLHTLHFTSIHTSIPTYTPLIPILAAPAPLLPPKHTSPEPATLFHFSYASRVEAPSCRFLKSVLTHLRKRHLRYLRGGGVELSRAEKRK